jgi:hypothetical protein
MELRASIVAAKIGEPAKDWHPMQALTNQTKGPSNMADRHLSADRLRELLHYDPDTGIFTRKMARRGHRSGDRSGRVCGNGYRMICVDYEGHLEHRLAFMYMTGSVPPVVDHINGVRDDNRWCNLRPSDKYLNAQNQRGPRKDNTTGFLGVIPMANGKFKARIKAGGSYVFLGFHDTPEAAHAAYVEAKRQRHEGCTI